MHPGYGLREAASRGTKQAGHSMVPWEEPEVGVEMIPTETFCRSGRKRVPTGEPSGQEPNWWRPPADRSGHLELQEEEAVTPSMDQDPGVGTDGREPEENPSPDWGHERATEDKATAARLLRQAWSRTCGRCARHGEGGTCPPFARDSCDGVVVGCTLLARHSWLIHKEEGRDARKDLIRIHGSDFLFLLPEREDYAEAAEQHHLEQDRPPPGTHNWVCEQCGIRNRPQHQKCHRKTCGWCPRCAQRSPTPCGKYDCQGWCDQCNNCPKCKGVRGPEHAEERFIQQVQRRTCGRCALHGQERTCPAYARDRCGPYAGVSGCTLAASHSWWLHMASRHEVREDLRRIHGGGIIFISKERSDDRASSG